MTVSMLSNAARSINTNCYQMLSFLN